MEGTMGGLTSVKRSAILRTGEGRGRLILGRKGYLFRATYHRSTQKCEKKKKKTTMGKQYFTHAAVLGRERKKRSVEKKESKGG